MSAAEQTDRYPSRTPGEPQPVERADPTVWSSGVDGPLDAATLAAHDNLGYTVCDEVLSPPEVQAYWAELQQLASDENMRTDERAVGDPTSGEVRSVFAAHQLSELIAELVTDPRLLDTARQILGSEVYLHQSRVTYLPGFSGTGYYWHSNFETWHADDGMPAPRALCCTVALTDNYPFNGGPMVLPGSHRTFVPCAVATRAEHYQEALRAPQFGVPSREALTKLAAEHGIEQFAGPAGSVTWLDANLMQGAGDNITPYPRSDILLMFNSVHNALAAPFGGGPPRPEIVASRDPAPLRR